MTKPLIFIRATVFNVLFYSLTALSCVAFLPGLFLSRKNAMKIVAFFVRKVYFLEKYVLGLDYEVRGIENIPQDGSFLVAAKHQSAYETMKLHLLFGDPAIILKKELLNIPLWGRYLRIIKPIAIDRTRGKKAIQQIIDGTLEVSKEGRPIVIFPQGTRVYPWQSPAEKPYKIGIARMHEATYLPIVPLALNSGTFWPKHRWIKWPGTVVFEFLEPITENIGISETIKDIETRLETTSDRLAAEAHDTYKYLPAPPKTKLTTDKEE